jgi:hypothetical protein
MNKIIYLLLILVLIPSLWAAEFNHLDRAKEFQNEIKTKFLKERNKLRLLIKEDETVDPEEFSLAFKKLNFKVYGELVRHLRKIEKPLPVNHGVRKSLGVYKEYLSQLEYEEKKVDKSFDLIQQNFQLLEDKIYHGQLRFFVDYISWQYSAVLKKPAGSSDLIVTNKGYCPGVSYARENKFVSFFVDACFLFTTGGVTSVDPSVTYVQSNITGTGLKTSLGLGYFVSSLGSELGLKLPVMLVSQNLEDPPAAGYKVTEGTSLIPMLGFYSRIPFAKYFIQTEFSKYLKEDQVQWSIGLGYKF